MTIITFGSPERYIYVCKFLSFYDTFYALQIVNYFIKAWGGFPKILGMTLSWGHLKTSSNFVNINRSHINYNYV